MKVLKVNLERILEGTAEIILDTKDLERNLAKVRKGNKVPPKSFQVSSPIVSGLIIKDPFYFLISSFPISSKMLSICIPEFLPLLILF